MRLLALIIFAFWFGSLFAQTQIMQAEYFVNDDPGIGNGETIALVPGQSINQDFNVPVGDLDAGLHYLHVRARNSEGKWSLYMRKAFYIGNFNFESQVVAAEYFIDSDPGLGNATDIPTNTGQMLNESFDVDLTGVENGLHYLHVRVLNSLGKWSLYMRKAFYVTDFVGDSDVITAEYFIDSDPGIGEASSLEVNQGPNINEVFEIPIGELETGYHVLHIRTQKSSGIWSNYARRPFYVLPLIEELSILEAEYFIDLDPGLGNGIPLSISEAHQIEENFSIVLSDTLSLGDHLLYIRVLNEAENWSFYASDIFTIEEGVGVGKNKLDFNVYPNPSSGFIFLETGDVQPEFVRIVDMTGKVVMTPNPQDRQVDIHRLAPGTYLLQIAADGSLYSKKVIRQ